MLDWTEAKVVASQDQRQSRLRLGSDIRSELGHDAALFVLWGNSAIAFSAMSVGGAAVGTAIAFVVCKGKSTCRDHRDPSRWTFENDGLPQTYIVAVVLSLRLRSPQSHVSAGREPEHGGQDVCRP